MYSSHIPGRCKMLCHGNNFCETRARPNSMWSARHWSHTELARPLRMSSMGGRTEAMAPPAEHSEGLERLSLIRIDIN
jgi:hypothetical protein